MELRLLIHRLQYCLFIFPLCLCAASPDSTISVTVTPPPLPNMFGHHSAVQSRHQPPKSEEFWLTTELLSADFRKGCLSTALCHEPKFKLMNTMVVNGEQAMVSWPVNGAADLVQEQAHSFVTHWTVGEPEDIALSCQIAGTDPSFGFSRVCDETPSKRVFNEAAIQRSLNGKLHWRDESAAPIRSQRALNGASQRADLAEESADGSGGRMIVELRGRCFNATLAVRKHLTRCPWCPDLNTHIVVSGQQSSDKDEIASSLQQKLAATDALFLHNLLIVALSGAIVFGVTGFCCALFIHCRYKKKHFRKGINAVAAASGGRHSAKRLLKFAPLPSEHKELVKQQTQQQHQCVVPVGSSTAISPQQLRKVFDAGNVDLRYETPWDKKYRVLPAQWLDSCAAEGGNASHYQTLTWAQSRNNNNCTLLNNNKPHNNYDYSVDQSSCCEQQHCQQQQQHVNSAMQQNSGSSIGTCGGHSGEGSAASTSATTIGCSSLSGGSCGGVHCPATSDPSSSGPRVSISPVVNHPGALFAALKQAEYGNGGGAETIGRTQQYGYGMPHTNPYACQQYYAHDVMALRAPPPNAPPPALPHSGGSRHDDSGLDSV